MNMCGIAGILSVERHADPEAMLASVTEMAETLAHRGPDDRGSWVDPNGKVAFGQTRLAVVDLSECGHQPMSSTDGRFTVVFNGEIYDFVGLRNELRRNGHVFRGTSDTEVLVEAISRWGIEGAIRRCDGMFAIAAWDRERDELTLARDRFGEKPLYYGRVGGAIVFGSELKAIERAPGFKAGIDRAALTAFLRLGYVPAPMSVYEGVLKLLPGHVVALRRDAPDAEPTPYWSLDECVRAGQNGRDGRPVDELTDELDARLRASVAERMIADVPLGAFLSGGIDSSLIVALMQAQSSRPIRTFTIGVPFEGYDESASARAVAGVLGTDHTQVDISPQDALDVVPSLPHIYDEPFADSSQIPTLLVSEVARRDVTVVLSGDGGDELFGGYVRYMLAGSAWRRLSRVPLRVRRGARSLLGSTPPPALDRIGRMTGLARPGEKLAKALDVLGEPDIEGVYRRLVSAWPDAASVVLGGPAEVLPIRSAEAPPGLSPVEWMMATDARTYLPDDILAKVDRASMHHSLEVRVPFLDPDVASFAWTLPEDVKIRRRTTKWLLRQLLGRYVPVDLIDRPKMGFAVPVGQWLRGPLRPWAEELLSPDRLRSQGYLDAARVRAVWDEHQRGQREHETRLWTVLMFQAWLDRARPRARAS